MIARCLLLCIAVSGASLLGPGTRAQGGSDGQLSSASAFDVLVKAQGVDDAAVGFAAQTTKTYLAFQALAREDTGVARANELIAKGTPAARVYGVILLSLADPESGERARRSLLGDTAPVRYTSGCETETATVGALMERLGAGDHVVFLRPDRKE